MIIVIVGVFTGLANFAGGQLDELSPRVADGRNLVWVSGGIFVAALIWQLHGLLLLFGGQNPRLKKLASILVGGAAGIFLLTFIVTNVLARTGSPAVQAWIAANTHGFVQEGGGTFTYLWWGVVALYIAVVLAVTVFSALFLGRIVLGASVAIAFHNLFNGGTFNPGIIVEVMFEALVDDVWAVVVTVGWFLVSSLVLRRFGGQSAIT